MERPCAASAGSSGGRASLAAWAVTATPANTIALANNALRIDSLPGLPAVGAAEQLTAARGVYRPRPCNRERRHAARGRLRAPPFLAAVHAHEQPLFRRRVHALRLVRRVSDGVDFGVQPAGVVPPAKAIHGTGDPGPCRRKEPTALHAARHVRMNELGQRRAWPPVHLLPVLPGVFAAKDPVAGEIGVNRLRPIGVRGHGDCLAAGQPLIARLPIAAAIVPAPYAQALAGQVQHVAAFRDRRNRCDARGRDRPGQRYLRPSAVGGRTAIKFVGTHLKERGSIAAHREREDLRWRAIFRVDHDSAEHRERAEQQQQGDALIKNDGPKVAHCPHRVPPWSSLTLLAYLATISPTRCMISACICSCSLSLPGGSCGVMPWPIVPPLIIRWH